MISSICAYCYAAPNNTKLKTCGKCGTRKFCSRSCQKSDWVCGHKVWCGKSGQHNVDWEIRESPGKGQGVFAKRKFKKGEKLIVERPAYEINSEPVVFKRPSSWTAGMEEYMMKILCPLGGSPQAKVDRNSMDCGENGSVRRGLFLFLSKVNHSCKPNSSHYYMNETGVKFLVASRTIEAGEEIYISYLSNVNHQTRVRRLREKFEFKCECEACSDVELSKKLDLMQQLDDDIFNYGSCRMTEDALECASDLLQLYDELDACYGLYHRTYYDMFQVAISQESKAIEAVRFVELAAKYSDLFFGVGNPVSTMYRNYASSPEKHREHFSRSERDRRMELLLKLMVNE